MGIDVLLPKRMLGRLLDVKVCKCGEENVEECLTFLGGSSAEIGGWVEECGRMEGVRNVLKVSELKKKGEPGELSWTI